MATFPKDATQQLKPSIDMKIITLVILNICSSSSIFLLLLKILTIIFVYAKCFTLDIIYTHIEIV